MPPFFQLLPSSSVMIIVILPQNRKGFSSFFAYDISVATEKYTL